MAILNSEMKPGVKCFVEGFAELGGDRVYVRSNGIIRETPAKSDVVVDVKVEQGPDGVPVVVTVPIENCFWISQKTQVCTLNADDIWVRPYLQKDVKQMMEIWNEVVEEGVAFPQEEKLTEDTAKAFFDAQTCCGVAVNRKDDSIIGMYILHPNNVGRCGHICNASYAVSGAARNVHVGEKLVQDSLQMGKIKGFRILQFNAVVATNTHARHLYERLGFVQLGVIPGGFRKDDGSYEDICPYYHEL